MDLQNQPHGPNSAVAPNLCWLRHDCFFWGFMPTFLYRCPTTRQIVQGFTTEEVGGETYESITCLACRQLHFVNPTTGKVLGEDDDE
jgi:hypothetical protein